MTQKLTQRYVLQLTATEFFTKPLTREELESYITESNLGGTVYLYNPQDNGIIIFVPIADTKVTLDWNGAVSTVKETREEIREAVEVEVKQNEIERPDNNPPDTAPSKRGKPKKKTPTLRKPPNGAIGTARNSGAGGPSGSLAGDVSLSAEELLVLLEDS